MLGTTNPFLKTRLDAAFEAPQDIEEIQGEIFEDILIKLIQIKREQFSIAEVILGTAGSGKTHLLSRLWRYSLRQENDYLFVSIPPPGDIQKIYTHIFREFIASLLHTLEDHDIAPLELLVAAFIKKILLDNLSDSETELRSRITEQENLYKLLQLEQFRERITAHVLHFAPQTLQKVDLGLIKTLLAIYNPDTKPIALQYLQGALISEKHQQLLETENTQLTEDLASRWLTGILDLTPMPILFAADQLESTYYRFRLAGLRKFIDVLIGTLGSNKLYLLILGQSKEWQNYVNRIANYQFDRINKITQLQPIPAPHMRLILKSRLENFQKSEVPTAKLDKQPFYPFSEVLVDKVIQRGEGNPRKVLNTARDAFRVGKEMGWSPHFENNWFKSLQQESDMQIAYLTDESQSSIERLDQILTSKLEEKRSILTQNAEVPISAVFDNIKGVLSQILGQISSVAFINKNFKISLNSMARELFVDIMLTIEPDAAITTRYGIIFLHQVDLDDYLNILRAILKELEAGQLYLDKIIAIRSERFHDSPVDSALTAQELIEKIENHSRGSFIVISSEQETDWLIYKEMIDESSDIELPFRRLNTSEVIQWYLIALMGPTNSVLRGLFSYAELEDIADTFRGKINRVLHESDDRFLDNLATLTDDLNTQDWEYWGFITPETTGNVSIPTKTADRSGLMLVLIYTPVNTKWIFFETEMQIRLDTMGNMILSRVRTNIKTNYWFLSTPVGKTLTQLHSSTVKDFIDQFGRSFILSAREKIADTYTGVIMAVKQHLYNKLIPYRPSKDSTANEISSMDLAEELSINKELLMGLLHHFGPDIWVEEEAGRTKLYALPDFYGSESNENYPAIPLPLMHDIKMDYFDKEKSELIENAVLEDKKPTIEAYEAKIQPSPIITAEEEEVIEKTPFDEAAEEMILWLERTGRSFPRSQSALLAAIFKKVDVYKEDISKFGLKLLQFRNQLEYVTVFEIATTIMKNYSPYRQEWKKLDSMPQNLRAITRRFLVEDYIIEALLTVNFSERRDVAGQWHELIYSTIEEYLSLTENIRQYGIMYWEKFFADEFFRDVPPLLNYYRDIFLTRLEKGMETSKQVLASYLAQIWTIYQRYNQITPENFKISTKWIFETLYKDLVPVLPSEATFFSELEPGMCTAFLQEPISENSPFDDQFKNQIHQEQTRFIEGMAQEFYTLTNSQIADNQPIQAIFSFTWYLYYVTYSEKAHQLLEKEKEKINRYYERLINVYQTFPEGILLLHMVVILRKLLPAENTAQFMLQQKILTTLTQTVNENGVFNEKDQEEEFKQLMEVLWVQKPFLKTTKEILGIFMPIWKKYLIPNITRTLVFTADDVFSVTMTNLESQTMNPVFEYPIRGRLRFIDSAQGRLAVEAPMNDIVKKLIDVISKLGFKSMKEPQKRKAGAQKGLDVKFRGIRDKFGLELNYRLMTFDGSQASVEWTVKWTDPTIRHSKPMKQFLLWLEKFHEVIFISVLNELKIHGKEKQKCGNCNEEFSNTRVNEQELVSCPKCKYPNISLNYSMK